MIGCSLLVHRCCFVKIDFSRFFSSKYLWFFHTLPERCCDTMVFIHPTGPVCTHFFGPVFSHPFGRIDIRTCFQPEVEKRIVSQHMCHVHFGNPDQHSGLDIYMIYNFETLCMLVKMVSFSLYSSYILTDKHTHTKSKII